MPVYFASEREAFLPSVVQLKIISVHFVFIADISSNAENGYVFLNEIMRSTTGSNMASTSVL